MQFVALLLVEIDLSEVECEVIAEAIAAVLRRTQVVFRTILEV